MSPDARFVLFASTANNLVKLNPTNALPTSLQPRANVFLRNRSNGITALVSINLSNSGGGNGDSFPTGISPDGRFALFESSASDLVPGDTNGVTDIFVRDLVSNVTTLVSVATNGIAGNGVCRSSVMTPDGHFVAFTSAANNLVPQDTNGIPDVFVRDLQSGTTTLASAGAIPTNSTFILVGSETPGISADGRFVAFYSAAVSLVPGVTNGGEIYLRDLVSQTTTWVSTDARAALGATNVVSFNLALSADGKFVAYETCTNPIPSSGTARGVILRYGLDTGLSDVVSTNAQIQNANIDEIQGLDMTPDGRFIVFVARTNLSLRGTTIQLWDAQSGTTTLVSGDTLGSVATNSISDWPSLDPFGRFVVFLSSNTNMVTNQVFGDFHLYERDVLLGTTVLLDVDLNGRGAGVGPDAVTKMSMNASFVAFDNPDTNLVPNDRNHDSDVFVRDIPSESTELISVRDPAFPSGTPNGPTSPPLSPDAGGQWIAFSSDADNLVPNDTNGMRDVFVRDLGFGTNLLISVNTNGLVGDGISSEPSFSGDGRFVAFTSFADDLVTGDTNKAQDVFVRDRQLNTTTLVSVNWTGVGPGNKSSYTPTIGGDGRFVLFRSQAGNLTTVTPSAGENLYLRDRQSGVTYALSTNGIVSASMTLDGRLVAFSDTGAAATGKVYIWDSNLGQRIETIVVGTSIITVSISPDGHRLAVFNSVNKLSVVDRIAHTNGLLATAIPNSRSSLKFSADSQILTYAAASATGVTNQVYLYDFAAGTNRLVSTMFGASTGANAGSDSPVIRADGRFVVFRSIATNLLSPPGINTGSDLYLFDRLAGGIAPLTSNGLTSTDFRSASPVFSGDGRTLCFLSWAAGLVPQDFNHQDDVFALSFLYASVSKSPGQGSIVSWRVRPGEQYHVQYKANLTDPTWQDLSGTITITGNQAQIIDPNATGSTSFYRIVAY
jgi:Tol biopolymer transport system component